MIAVPKNVPHTHVPLPIGAQDTAPQLHRPAVRSLRNNLQLTFYRGLGLPIIAVPLQIYIR